MSTMQICIFVFLIKILGIPWHTGEYPWHRPCPQRRQPFAYVHWQQWALWASSSKERSGNDKSIHGNHRNRSSRQELNPMSFYHGIIWGFVVGLWMVPCALLLNNTCRISYFRLLDKIYEKV